MGDAILKRVILVALLLIALSSIVYAQGFAHSQLKNPPMNPQAGKMLMSLNEDEWASIDISYDDRMAIKEFNFTPNKNLSSPGVMIYGLLTLSSDVPEAPGRAYQYFEFKYTNMVYWDVKNSSFIFQVKKEWLDREQNSASLISLFKKDSEHWEEVPTRIIGLDNETVTYYAISEGSRYFVIAVRGAPSNFEDFQTIDSSTLFLQQLGSNEIIVVQEKDGEEEATGEMKPGEEQITTIKENETQIVVNQTESSFNGQYYSEDWMNETQEAQEPSKNAGWLLLLIFALIVVFLLYRWKTKPTI
ncbi:MAG: PGF-pre-PGF domain-containing protein, partial [Nanoarchaeota archaeon]|nr:PGF-pre-PGF domain-containing protein [Nanoarchaeota archaeon]